MTGSEFAEVLKAFESDKRLNGATWDRSGDHFPDPDVFTLMIKMPDGREFLVESLAGFRPLQDKL
jgi:hypothetical protein